MDYESQMTEYEKRQFKKIIKKLSDDLTLNDFIRLAIIAFRETPMKEGRQNAV